MIGRVMGAGTGKHTISMKLAQGSADDMAIYCGMVRDGAPCNEDHTMGEKAVHRQCQWVHIAVHIALHIYGRARVAGV